MIVEDANCLSGASEDLLSTDIFSSDIPLTDIDQYGLPIDVVLTDSISFLIIFSIELFNSVAFLALALEVFSCSLIISVEFKKLYWLPNKSLLLSLLKTSIKLAANAGLTPFFKDHFVNSALSAE